MKRITAVSLALVLSGLAIYAANIILAWDYDFSANPDVTTFRLYAVPGTNTPFAAGNANATRISTVTFSGSGFVTNIQGTVVGLAAGAWTFTATAISSSGAESVNATSIWAVVRPGRPQNLNIP